VLAKQMAKLLSGVGLTSIQWPQAHVRWGQDHGKTPSMIILGNLIGRKYQILVSSHLAFFYFAIYLMFHQGISLLRKIKITIPECNLHIQDFEDFNQMLSHEQLNEVNAWKLSIERWEEDRS
jgi:hypothetical protein